MKIAIDAGHNCRPDNGCTGLRQEDVLAMAVSRKLIHYLTEAGLTTVWCTPTKVSSVSDSLRQRVNKANGANVDYFFSIHFDCFNGKASGTGTFAMSSTGRKVGKAIVDEIAKLGYINRGVKDGSHLFVVKNTDAPAVLIECCFCDNERDIANLDIDDMARAISKGIISSIT